MQDRASSRHSLRLEENDDAWMSLRDEEGYACDSPSKGQLLWRGITAAAISNLRGEAVTEDDVAMAARKVDLRLTVRNAAWSVLAKHRGVEIETDDFKRAMRKGTYRATFGGRHVQNAPSLRDILGYCAVHAYGDGGSTLSSMGGAIGTDDRSRYLGQANRSDAPAITTALADYSSLSAAGGKGHASLGYTDDRARYLGRAHQRDGPPITSALEGYTSFEAEGDDRAKGQASLGYTDDRAKYLGAGGDLATDGPKLTGYLGSEHSSLETQGTGFGPAFGHRSATDAKVEAARERRAQHEREQHHAGRKPAVPGAGVLGSRHDKKNGPTLGPKPGQTADEALRELVASAADIQLPTLAEPAARESSRSPSPNLRLSARESISALLGTAPVPIWRPATKKGGNRRGGNRRGAADTADWTKPKLVTRMSLRMSKSLRTNTIYTAVSSFFGGEKHRKPKPSKRAPADSYSPQTAFSVSAGTPARVAPRTRT